MDNLVWHSKHPKTCLTNHGLIKLIIIDSIEQQGSTWAMLLAGIRVPTQEEEEECDTEKWYQGIETKKEKPSRRSVSSDETPIRSLQEEFPAETSPVDTPTKDSCIVKECILKDWYMFLVDSMKVLNIKHALLRMKHPHKRRWRNFH